MVQQQLQLFIYRLQGWHCLRVGFLVIFLLSGCASINSNNGSGPTPPYDPLLKPSSILIEDVPFYKQARYHCGPAVMAMLINYYRSKNALFPVDPVDPDTVAGALYLPKKRGSYTVEMRAVSRRYQLIPYPLISANRELDSLSYIRENLLREQPIVVLQNMRFEAWPKWHYAIVIGVDDHRGTVTLISGDQPRYTVSQRLFLNTWKKADYWAMVPLPKERLAARLTVSDIVATLEDMVQVGLEAVAESAYRYALQLLDSGEGVTDPETALIHFALGFLAHKRSDWQVARTYYQSALAIDPAFTEALNNLAYILQKQGENDASIRTIERALQLEPDNVELQDSYQELKGLIDQSRVSN